MREHDGDTQEDKDKNRLLPLIEKLSEQLDEIPQSLYLHVESINNDHIPERSGQYTQTHRRTLNGRVVAAKVIRCFQDMKEQIREWDGQVR